jgi:hypothetical protein
VGAEHQPAGPGRGGAAEHLGGLAVEEVGVVDDEDVEFGACQCSLGRPVVGDRPGEGFEGGEPATWCGHQVGAVAP